MTKLLSQAANLEPVVIDSTNFPWWLRLANIGTHITDIIGVGVKDLFSYRFSPDLIALAVTHVDDAICYIWLMRGNQYYGGFKVVVDM